MAKEPTVTVSRDYLQSIEKKVKDLNTLVEVSAIISSTLDLNDLIKLVMEKAKKVMDADACSILLYNRNTNKLEFEVAISEEEETSHQLKNKITLDIGQGIAGWVAEKLESVLIEDAATDSRFYTGADKLTGFKTKSLIAAPLIGRGGLIGVAEILNPKHKDSFDDYDVDIFQTHCRNIAVAIENANFHKESIEREKHRQELEIASIVQKSFLPESPTLKKGNIIVSASNVSARKVGGDVYDFAELDDGRIGVLIGDVSGKGVSAALFMAKVISEFRYIAHMTDSPEATFKQLNSRLSNAPRGMFLTAAYSIIDTETGNVTISVAGHPPFLRLSDGKVEAVSIEAGPPLGIMPVEYVSRSFTMKKGDKLLFLTDGAFDAKNSKGERLGFDRFMEFVSGHVDADNLIQTVCSYVDDFEQSTERADDLTFVEVKMV